MHTFRVKNPTKYSDHENPNSTRKLESTSNSFQTKTMSYMSEILKYAVSVNILLMSAVKISIKQKYPTRYQVWLGAIIYQNLQFKTIRQRDIVLTLHKELWLNKLNQVQITKLYPNNDNSLPPIQKQLLYILFCGKVCFRYTRYLFHGKFNKDNCCLQKETTILTYTCYRKIIFRSERLEQGFMSVAIYKTRKRKINITPTMDSRSKTCLS